MTGRLDMVGIAVHDMGRSLAFYRLLGLQIPPEADAEPHVEAAGNGVRLAWDTIALLRDIYGEWEERPAGHRIELAFLCDSPADVDALYSRITAAGYSGRRAPWDAFWGQRYAVVEDPDGNLISLFAPME